MIVVEKLKSKHNRCFSCAKEDYVYSLRIGTGSGYKSYPYRTEKILLCEKCLNNLVDLIKKNNIDK